MPSVPLAPGSRSPQGRAPDPPSPLKLPPYRPPPPRSRPQIVHKESGYWLFITALFIFFAGILVGIFIGSDPPGRETGPWMDVNSEPTTQPQAAILL